jgi:hypothetical protein
VRREGSLPPVLLLLRGVRRRRIEVDAVFSLSATVTTFVLLQWLSRSFLPAATAVSTAAVAALAAGASVLLRQRKSWSAAAMARHVETLRPQCRNLVITAEELWRHPERATQWMVGTVLEQASRSIQGLSPDQVVPGAPAWSVAILATVASAGVLLAPQAREVARTVVAVVTPTAERIRGVQAARVMITVRPPAYSKLDVRTLTNPPRLDVLEGSRLSFTLSGNGCRRLRFGGSTLGDLTAGSPSVEHAARDSGYFAIERPDGTDPLFIVLSVEPDRVPTVRIEQPARDLLLPDALRTVPVTLSASDDLGLASFELRYTKMSGAGERFEFVEGEMPIRLERTSSREWRGTGTIAPANLQVGPGDSIVYRAVARDARAGAAGLGSSDTFFIEVAGPGQVPLDAVGMPPDENRYALSQQMIVLKIERLQSQQRALTAVQAREEASMIAAEQRSVRANFVFLLGGHVEDEEAEAEQSSEIAEGRLMNSARRDIDAAVRDMTRTEQGLTAVDLQAALSAARAAVDSLQRAFGRNRYFLRTLSARSRIDPSRRLTGQLNAVAQWTRNAPDAGHGEGDAARALLAELMNVSNAIAGKWVRDPSAVERLAERALSIDPSSSTWQSVARRLLEVRATLNRPAEAQSKLNEVSATVRREADRGLLPRTPLSIPASPLLRAWEGRSPR